MIKRNGEETQTPGYRIHPPGPHNAPGARGDLQLESRRGPGLPAQPPAQRRRSGSLPC